MYKVVYFVRHGHYRIPHPKNGRDNTESNVLTVKGIEDIIKLAHKLRHLDKNIGIIYSSPIERTVETAKLLAKTFRVDIQIREQIKEDYYQEGDVNHLKDVYDKFQEIVDEALDYQYGNAIIVSHKFPISLYIAHSGKFSYEDISNDKRHVNLIDMGRCFKVSFNKKDFVGYESI